MNGFQTDDSGTVYDLVDLESGSYEALRLCWEACPKVPRKLRRFAFGGPRVRRILRHRNASVGSHAPMRKIQACGRCSRFLIGLHSETAAGVSPLRL